MVELTLVSGDEKSFKIDEKAAKMSMTIKLLLEDVGNEENIPLPNVQSAILSKVIEYCEKHKNDDPPVENADAAPSEDEGDLDFCKEFDQATLFEMIKAANYLDIRSLLDVTCKTVANMIKGKTTEQIRATFNIENDFTPEEEEAIRKENAWCNDLDAN